MEKVDGCAFEGIEERARAVNGSRGAQLLVGHQEDSGTTEYLRTEIPPHMHVQ